MKLLCLFFIENSSNEVRNIFLIDQIFYWEATLRVAMLIRKLLTEASALQQLPKVAPVVRTSSTRRI